jgi:hypothetical protein
MARKKYALTDGLILEIKYRRQNYRLQVLKKEDQFQFKVGNKVFLSLTAAAKHVMNTDQEVNGPRFWKVPIAKI